jgi:hypothetical protein
MNFYYGAENDFLDVTDIVYSKCVTPNNILTIPPSDPARAALFTDPMVGVKKYIVMRDEKNRIRTYDEGVGICLNLNRSIKRPAKLLYPITFSIPEEKIVSDPPTKTKIMSNLIPGVVSTYIYNTEESYYNEYQSSIFATTTRKSGWDCLRHYEIIANHSIPYFPNIESCPPNTMALFPKDLIKKANNLCNGIRHKQTISSLSDEELSACSALSAELMSYLRENLTTCKMAQYILDKTKSAPNPLILFLSGQTSPDYLRCLTLHGFKKLLGTKCHDYPIIPHIYRQDQIDYAKLYGKGMTYTNLLDLKLRANDLDNTIETDITSRKYDLIIYGSYHRGMPFYDLVQKYYAPNEIILLCGEDIHRCDYVKWINKGHYVFVREL